MTFDAVFHQLVFITLATVPFHIHEGANDRNPLLIYNDTARNFSNITNNLFRYHPISFLGRWSCAINEQKPTRHGWPFQRE